jgi:hypothetical protein
VAARSIASGGADLPFSSATVHAMWAKRTMRDGSMGALGLRILFAMFLWFGSASAGNAAGYWSCSGDKWIAVGDPQHAMPTKSCGSQLEIPSTQLACEQGGGRWGPAGIFPRPICKMPTHDAGRTCADDGECEGSCLAELTPAQRDLAKQWVTSRQKQPLLGKCTPSVPIFGCMAVVREGFVTGIMCRD